MAQALPLAPPHREEWVSLSLSPLSMHLAPGPLLPGSSGVSTGAIAAAVAVVLVLAGVGVAGFVIWKRRQQGGAQAAPAGGLSGGNRFQRWAPGWGWGCCAFYPVCASCGGEGGLACAGICFVGGGSVRPSARGSPAPAPLCRYHCHCHCSTLSKRSYWCCRFEDYEGGDDVQGPNGAAPRSQL